MVYCLEYMKGDDGSARFFFFMTLFIGSMQLIVLSDNLLSLFVGWEMVGLCSYALIGHYYKDETKDWVGTPGEKALGEEQAYPPSHAGMKAFVMTRVGDVAMLAGILILFYYAKTFNYYQLAATSSILGTEALKRWPPCPSCAPHLRRGRRQVGTVPAPRMASGCDGRPRPGFRSYPRSHDGEGRRSACRKNRTALLLRIRA